MNFILISEAVKITGLDRQTIRNWIDKGIVPAQKINGTFYVDKDTFEALSEQMRDVDNARKRLDALKEAYISEKEEFREMKSSVSDEHNTLRFLSVCVNSGIQTRFFDTIIEMLRVDGIITGREAQVLSALINGNTFNDIKEKCGYSRERARQIAEKAVRKSRCLLEEKDDKAKDDEIAKLKDEVSVLKKMVYRQAVNATNVELTDTERWLLQMDKSEFYGLLSRKLVNEHLSVRALNVLLGFCYGEKSIRTIGDLCQMSRDDILKQRNVGKGTIKELTDFLHENGLDWNTDIDKVIQMR